MLSDPAHRRGGSKPKEGHIVLLENLRFHKEEEKTILSLLKKLASYTDIYVNDAF